MTTVGTASADPGELTTGTLRVGESRDGSECRLPVAVINGAGAGDRLYMQAASDGDELNGVGVVNRVIQELDPTELTGEVVCIGIVNTHGFHAESHRNPIDNTKINRTYPGDANGSSSERIAATTFEIAESADLILDLHQGSTSRMINECRVRCGTQHRLHDGCLELAKVFDAGTVLDRKGPDGQLARVAPDEGIPTVDPELGGSVGWDPRSVEVGVTGVFNVLRHYDFLDGEAPPSPQDRASRFEQYASPRGGLIHLQADLGDHVTPGEDLFTVTTVFGERKATVEAEDEGILWRARRRPQVATGEYVCTLGVDVDRC